MLQVHDAAHLLFTLLLFALAMPMAASAAMAIGVDAASQSGLADIPGSNTSALHSTCKACRHCLQLPVKCRVCQQVKLVGESQNHLVLDVIHQE